MKTDKLEKISQAIFVTFWISVLIAGIALSWFGAPANGQEVRPAIQPIDAINSPEAVSLGQKLFNDRRLSRTGETSCGTCHQQEHGYSDGKPVSDGVTQIVNGQAVLAHTSRNAPTIIGAQFKQRLFHDGRATFLEGQASQPLVNRAEMGNGSLQEVINRIAVDQDYQQRFARTFQHNVNARDMLFAIAAFERTVDSPDALIDKVLTWSDDLHFERHDDWRLSPKQRRGLDLFVANCIQCHSGPSYRREEFVNTGVSLRFNDQDQGRQGISGQQIDARKFVIPTLREIQKTGPYGHNGRVNTLAEMVSHYSHLPADPLLDQRLLTIRLTPADEADLLELLSTAFAGRQYPAFRDTSLVTQ